MPVSPKHLWEAYTYQTNDGLVVASFDTEARSFDQSNYPHCVRIIIPIRNPDQNGAPDNDEAQVLWALEDELVADLDKNQVECLLVGRLTHKGDRELVFQVAKLESFRPDVGLWMSHHPEYEFDASEHEGWSFFFESVWPSTQEWQLITDRRVIESLLRHGSDALKPHRLEYVFYGPCIQLKCLQDRLIDCGYSVLEFRAADEQLIMVKEMPLDKSLIFQESLSHLEMCSSVGVKYDGWGCLTVK